jgi:uncharacterized protein
MSIAPVGRTSLTNYLMQSVLGVALFYGIGLGLYLRVTHLAAFGIAAAVFLAQMALSRIWLARSAHGPAEALWRRLTYGRPAAPEIRR